MVDSSGPVVTVTQGFPANINCSVQGYPLPSIKWLFQEQELTPNGRISINSTTIADKVFSILTIGAVSYVRHSGLYACLAENSVGEDLVVTQLSVKCKPKLYTMFSYTCYITFCSQFHQM